MRINGLLKVEKNSEAGVASSKQLLENLGRFVDEVANSGLLFANDVPNLNTKSDRINFFDFLM